MGNCWNKHEPTDEFRQRVCDLVMTGAPRDIICEILDISEETLVKYYAKEMKTATAVAIERIGRTVYQQALAGNEKSQALYLRTKGSAQGWVERHVVEAVSSAETDALQQKVKELEDKHTKEY